MITVLFGIFCVLLVCFGVAGILILVLKACDSCEYHRFDRVDDGNGKYATYICEDCGKVKKIKIR